MSLASFKVTGSLSNGEDMHFLCYSGQYLLHSSQWSSEIWPKGSLQANLDKAMSFDGLDCWVKVTMSL